MRADEKIRLAISTIAAGDLRIRHIVCKIMLTSPEWRLRIGILLHISRRHGFCSQAIHLLIHASNIVNHRPRLFKFREIDSAHSIRLRITNHNFFRERGNKVKYDNIHTHTYIYIYIYMYICIYVHLHVAASDAMRRRKQEKVSQMKIHGYTIDVLSLLLLADLNGRKR